jgi:N-acetylneuraminate synthase
MHERMFGPDVTSSLTPDRLIDLVNGVRFAWEMRTNPVDKFVQLSALKGERDIFTRSLVAARSLMAGETLTAEMVAYKKPGGGLFYQDLPKLLGKRLRHSISCDQPLGLKDFE